MDVKAVADQRQSRKQQHKAQTPGTGSVKLTVSDAKPVGGRAIHGQWLQAAGGVAKVFAFFVLHARRQEGTDAAEAA